MKANATIKDWSRRDRGLIIAHQSASLRHFWNPFADPAYIFKEDIGSLFEVNFDVKSMPERVEGLQWLKDNIQHDWNWLIIDSLEMPTAQIMPPILDSRILLFTRILDASDAMLYKLSRQVFTVYNPNQLHESFYTTRKKHIPHT